MRYALLVAVLAGLIAASSSASAPAPTTTLKADWNETKTFEGGQLKLRVTRLVVQGPSWTVAASITNRSTRTIHIDSVTYPSARIAGMSLAYQIPPAGGYGFGAVPRINVLQMRSARPGSRPCSVQGRPGRAPSARSPCCRETSSFGSSSGGSAQTPTWKTASTTSPNTPFD